VSWLTAAHPRWWTYLSGQVKVRFGELTESIEYIKSGKLRKKGRQRKAQVVGCNDPSGPAAPSGDGLRRLMSNVVTVNR
jgi:hypothetical protein